MSISASVAAKLNQHLSLLYGDDCADIYSRLEQLIAGYQPALSKDQSARQQDPLWDESTVVLITYGDQIQDENVPALRSLRNFCLSINSISRLIRSIYSPFFPTHPTMDFQSSTIARFVRAWETGRM